MKLTLSELRTASRASRAAAGLANGQILRSLTPGDTGSTGGNPAAGELEKWKAIAAEREETIRDLRARLDAESEERRRLTAILSDKRAVAAAPRQSWWPWRRA